LSTIDLSHAAAQPMANRDQTVVITFNGEIYNHGVLRRELQLVREPRYAR
jgi:asparagine synthase (glutamine-hydrolysing)